MCSSYQTLFSALFCLNVIRLVHAALYVVTPYQGSVCRGNQPCTVTWLEDGRSPLLNSIGVCTVGLYTGNQQLVQTLQPVNVNSQASFTFTPNPAAGPDSANYYIAFISTTYKINGTTPYIDYSPFFQLTDMSGSFNSPNPSATSSIPIPSSLTQSHSTSTSTITVGTIRPTPTPATSTARASSSSSPLPASVVLPSSSGFVTVSTSSPSATTSSTTSTHSSGAISSTNLPLSTLCLLLPILVSSSLLVFP